MDVWFPWLVLFCGAWLRVSLLFPQVRERMDHLNPIPGAVKRCEVASTVFLIGGALWGMQHLWLG